jgi:hypothetical protein
MVRLEGLGELKKIQLRYQELAVVVVAAVSLFAGILPSLAIASDIQRTFRKEDSVYVCMLHVPSAVGVNDRAIFAVGVVTAPLKRGTSCRRHNTSASARA